MWAFLRGQVLVHHFPSVHYVTHKLLTNTKTVSSSLGPYYCQLPSQRGKMVDAGTTIDSELCGLPMVNGCREILMNCNLSQKFATISLASIYCYMWYLDVLQSVPPSLWRGTCWQWELHFVSWGMTVLRAGLKRVELHVQRSKLTLDT